MLQVVDAMKVVEVRIAEREGTQWTTPLSSKVNLPHAINLCRANLVTLPYQFGGMKHS